MPDLSRRKLIGSLICLVAAPAIVRVSSIMPVKAMECDGFYGESCLPDFGLVYADVVRDAFVPRLYVQYWNYETDGMWTEERSYVAR